MMADLPGEAGVLMMGGADAPGPPNLPDMWSFEVDGGWRNVTPPSLPELEGFEDLTGNAFEFDSKSEKGVFVDIEGNTWSYDPDANAWEPMEAMDGPTELLGTSIVYDSGSDRLIAFGGFSFSGGLNAETWAYDLDANTWERMHPERHPSPRNYYQMAYDPKSDRVILFGGSNDSVAFDDTWAYDYDTDSWTEISPAASPAARTYGWMVYDLVGGRMIMFGGTDYPAEEPMSDTWAFDPRTDSWAEIDSPGPAPRGWHAMAYDAERREIVLFGGGPSREEFTAETWIFDPRADSWSQVT